jgi:Flp pilus assembly protein TadD
LWFAAMPAHVEPVAWISGRTDLLAGTLALLALWLDRRDRAAGRERPGWMAPAALAGALLAKESAAGWTGVILVAEWTRREGPGRAGAIARWLAPYLAVTVAWLIVHFVAAGPSGLPPWVDESLRARRQAAGWLLLPQYLSFLVPGFPHASDVPVTIPVTPHAPVVWLGAAATLAAFAATTVLTLRRSRLAVPAAMVVMPVLPGITVALARGFLPSGERMVYLASAGVAWLAAEALAAALARVAAWRYAMAAAAGALILVSAVETVRLVHLWANDQVVFRTLTERYPSSATGWLGLGEVMMRGGRTEEAARALDHAASLDPRLPSVAMARAELAYRSGAWTEVLDHAGRALELDPRMAQARLVRASTLIRLRRPAEAAPDIERLGRERPTDVEVLMLEGQLQLALGRPGDAVAPLLAATRVESGNAGLWAALGSAQAANGDLAAARGSLERALALDPGAPALWHRLADVCAALGDSAAARAARERAAGAAR